MIITFCGHAKLNYSEAVKKNLHKELDILINSGADNPYLDCKYDFSLYDTRVCKKKKQKNYSCNIK